MALTTRKKEFLGMVSQGMLLKQFSLATVVILLVLAAATARQQSEWSERCGDVDVPFPFGMDDKTYLDDTFLITCNLSFKPPKAFLRKSDIEVTNISLEGELSVMQFIAKDCYNQLGNQIHNNEPWIWFSKNTISSTKNKFFAIGCDTIAFVQARGVDETYTTGCLSFCGNKTTGFISESCSGGGCCKTPIVEGLKNFSVVVNSHYNHSTIRESNPCSYAFVTEETKFKSEANISFIDLESTEQLPMVINWAIGNESEGCDKAKKRNSFACKNNSKCVDVRDGSGDYRCQCLTGYEGNPYYQDGCRDIDECNSTTSNPCGRNSICQNLPGNYTCICLKGFNKVNETNYCIPSSHRSLLFVYGALGLVCQNRVGGYSCYPPESENSQVKEALIGVGTGILGLILLLTCAWSLHKFLMKRRKEKFFKLNGGLLLQHQLHSGEPNIEKTKLFKSNELEKATDQYSPNRVLGQGGHGTVYKGMLADGKIVAVKKSKRVDQGKVAEFINEVVILSQINHRNVVKLLGCCLETQVPLLVYEFIPNGTLYQYIHHQKQDFPLTLNARLQIAAEIAAAISYLHSAASFPIYHRDIKSSNILLDEKYRAKIADFGTSRSISIEQTHLTTLVHGTFGYLDPEYFQSSQFTDKSDVYSFGVVLVELLTGQKPISTTRAKEATSIAACFIVSMEENRLFDIVDIQVMMEGNKEAIMAVANLAKRCLDLSGKKRPSMKQVATELERIQKPVKDSNYGDQNFEETEFDQNEVASMSGWSHSYNAAASSSDALPLVSFSH